MFLGEIGFCRIGVDPTKPDFSQKHKSKDVDSFYACAIAKASDPSDFDKAILNRSTMGRLMLGNNNMNKKSIVYQWLLWKTVLSKEKTPAAAQEAWMLWENNNNMIAASEAAAGAASHAAFQSQMQTQQMQMQSDMNASRPINCVNDGMHVNCQ